MLLDPGKVLVNIGGVHNQQEMVGQILTVNEKVVHSASVRIAHHAVEDFSGFVSTDIVGENVVDESLGLRAFHKDFSHVGHIEHTHLFPHGQVLLGDGAVLDGHHESRKGAHLGIEGQMGVVQAGFLQFRCDD